MGIPHLAKVSIHHPVFVKNAYFVLKFHFCDLQKVIDHYVKINVSAYSSSVSANAIAAFIIE